MISANYCIQEYVPPTIFKQFGEMSIWFIDQRIVLFNEWLSEYCGVKAIVNDWHKGGQYHDSGFRDPLASIGAPHGQHFYGRATDSKVPEQDYEVLRDLIRSNFKSLNARFGITTIEKDTPTWLHVDTRWTGLDHLFECNFK